MKKKVTFNARGPHHLYMGIMIMFLGWTMQPWAMYDGVANIFLAGGALIALDDIIEHTVTGSTPLRAFFSKALVPLLWKLRK